MHLPGRQPADSPRTGILRPEVLSQRPAGDLACWLVQTEAFDGKGDAFGGGAWLGPAGC
jgi:hypothetical protein